MYVRIHVWSLRPCDAVVVGYQKNAGSGSGPGSGSGSIYFLKDVILGLGLG